MGDARPPKPLPLTGPGEPDRAINVGPLAGAVDLPLLPSRRGDDDSELDDDSVDDMSASSAAPSVVAADARDGPVFAVVCGCGEDPAGFPDPDVNWEMSVSSSSLWGKTSDFGRGAGASGGVGTYEIGRAHV